MTARRLTLAQAERLGVENPYVASFARRLHGDTPLAVGSTAETSVVLACLRGGEHSGLFNGSVTVTDAGRAKPDPSIFVLAAHRHGVASERVLVLRDSGEALEAVSRAGMIDWDVGDPGVWPG